jgi:glycosyltransferase involved in cell wall biosynthesis
MSEAKPPLVSIITVCYNAADALTHTLESVAQQTYPHIQHVIVDGASTDHTPEVIKRFPHACFYSEPDEGIYDAMNKGLSYAYGDYVLFLNAGDTLHAPDTLQKIFEQLPEGDVYYGDVMMVDAWYRPLGLRSEITPHKLPANLHWKSLRFGMLVSHQAFIVRRGIAPHYDLSHPYSSDIDWVIRCLKRARKVVHTQQIIAHFQIGGFSYKNRLPSLIDRFKVFRKHYGLLPTIGAHIYIALRAALFRLRKGKY